MISNTRLAIYKGNQLDLAFPVTETATTIGRDDGNPIQLPDPQVSKRHAVIRTSGDIWTIEDLDSTNGTMVNGAGIKRTVLKNGDRISESVRLNWFLNPLPLTNGCQRW